jgi:hypothetical protein
MCPNNGTQRLVGRHHHAQSLSEKFLFVTGGKDHTQKFLSDFFYYSIKDSYWKNLKVIETNGAKEAARLVKRMRRPSLTKKSVDDDEKEPNPDDKKETIVQLLLARSNHTMVTKCTKTTQVFDGTSIFELRSYIFGGLVHNEHK